MDNRYELSCAAERYLARFRSIRREMICGMTGASLTQSISHNFIVQMIPHHEAAIEMSRNILEYTDLIPLRSIAENIISSQTQSIANMRAIEARCGMLLNSQRELCLYQQCFRRIAQTMFFRMGAACADGQTNADFMREMIPHHEGAIAMSKNALRFSICTSLKPILNAIIVSQSRGVEEMQQLLCQITA